MASNKKSTQLNKEIKAVSGRSSAKQSKTVRTMRKAEPHMPQNEPEKGRSGRVVRAVVGIALGIFLMLCLFHVFGTVGSWISYGLFGLFGSMAYVFPILIALLFFFSGISLKKARFFCFSILCFLMLCGFAHLISAFSLNNHDILSYYTACAKGKTGGGIVGGTIALGLYLMLSKTGAMIITILVIILCFFFLFEQQIKFLFSMIFTRNEEDVPEAEDEEASEPMRIRRKKKSSVSREERMVNAYEQYLEPWEEEDYEEYYEDRLSRSRQSGKSSVSRRHRNTIEDDPVYVIENPDETIIRIKKNRKPEAKNHSVALTRSTRKAQPMRSSSTDTSRTARKARGISQETALLPSTANGDEIHEITQRNHTSQNRKSSKGDFFDQTVIKPVETDQLEWNTKALEPVDTRKEARVTSVTQAAVNRKKKESRPVKIRKEESISTNKLPVSASTKTMQQTAYHSPPMELLARVRGRSRSSEAELEKIAEDLEIILEQFGVHATVTDIQAGPSVTRFELQPELGTRVNRITSLADDLKLNLGVTEIRIEAPIPGRQAVGIEIPNKNRQTVYMRELLEEPVLINHPSKIAFAAGQDISGNIVVADIAKMPHLLVAGTTGSGKSVFLNTILMTILYRARPSEVGLIIIDPKKVEFGVYQGIPHLMKDVVTDPTQAVSTLRWAVSEMTNRYQRMQMSAVRDFKSYNAKFEKGTVSPEEENPRKMNQIVIIIDELADLMMVAKKEAEALICRLAQLARAAGIHLIIATQRPSVDVVTGLIKANVPARVALLVSSQIDSRTIIDMPGAEKLLGNGDMLFYPTGYVKPVRVQGAFVSDDEIQKTVSFLIQNNDKDYFAEESREIEKFMASSEDEAAAGSDKEADAASKYDEYFYEAGKVCIEMGKASSSMLQRRFNLGFNRAARIIDQLEEFGVVGPQQGAKPREIIVDLMTFEDMYRNRNH